MVAFRYKLLLRAMSGSVVLGPLGSVLMSVACITTGLIRTMMMKSEDQTELVSPFSDLKKLALPLAEHHSKRTDSNLHGRAAGCASERWSHPSPDGKGIGKAGFTPSRSGTAPAARSDKFTYNPGPHPGPQVGPPQHLPRL